MVAALPPKGHTIRRQTRQTPVTQAQPKVEEGRLIDGAAIRLFEADGLDKARPAIGRKTALSAQGL